MSICVLKPDLAQQYQASAKVSIFIATFPRKYIFVAHIILTFFGQLLCMYLLFNSVWFKREYFDSSVKERLRFFCPYHPVWKQKNWRRRKNGKTFLPHIVYAAAVFFFVWACKTSTTFPFIDLRLRIKALTNAHTLTSSDTTRFFSFRFHWHFPWTPTATEWKIRDYFVPIFSQMRKISLLFFSYSFTSIDGKA